MAQWATTGDLCLPCNLWCFRCMGVCDASCAPCPNGLLDAPGGYARSSSPHGAVGGFALAWLKLFLLGEESTRAQLLLRPELASGFESDGLAIESGMAESGQRVMERT